MSEDADMKDAPEGVRAEEAEAKEKEAKSGDDKMPPPAAAAAAAGGASNKSASSGSDAIKAAVKAGNINIHQQEREISACSIALAGMRLSNLCSYGAAVQRRQKSNNSKRRVYE